MNTHPAVRMFTLVLAWPAASRMCSSGGSPRFTGDSPTRWNGGRLVGKPMKPGSHRTSNFQSARDRGERTPRRRGVSAAGDMRQIGDLEYGGTTPRGKTRRSERRRYIRMERSRKRLPGRLPRGSRPCRPLRRTRFEPSGLQFDPLCSPAALHGAAAVLAFVCPTHGLSRELQ